MLKTKTIKAIFFTGSTTILCALFTPFSFHYFWLKILVSFLTLFSSLILVKEIRNKTLKQTFIFLISASILLVIFFSFISHPFYNGLSSWKTVWITHRQKENPKIHIAQQMFDIGARGYSRRIVKVIPLTPLFDWVSAIDTTNLGSGWTLVNEDYNPFNWK